MVRQFFSSPWALVIVGALLAVAVYPLYTAQPILSVILIPGMGMPYGTVIAWSALTLFPFWALLFIQQIEKLLPSLWRLMAMRTNRIALLFGIFWGIICFFLAENWAFSFSSALNHQDERAQTFWVVTAIIPILTLVSLLATAIGIGVYVSKREKKKD